MSDEPAPAPAEAPPAEADSPAPAGSSDAAPGPTPSSKEADQVRLYLGNLSYDSDEPRLRSLFSEFGEVTDIFLPEDRSTGRRRGFGFVTFAERAAAEVAIAKMDQAEVDGRTIKVNESRPRGDGPGFNASGAPTVKLYVGNLAFETNEESVRALFEKHGAVSDCFLPVDRESGRPRGFAFVTMSSEDARTAMSAIDGMEIEGRAIRVSESKPKASDRDRDRGGGGGYGGESTRPLAAFPSVSSRPSRVPLSPPPPRPPPPLLRPTSSPPQATAADTEATEAAANATTTAAAAGTAAMTTAAAAGTATTTEAEAAMEEEGVGAGTTTAAGAGAGTTTAAGAEADTTTAAGAGATTVAPTTVAPTTVGTTTAAAATEEEIAEAEPTEEEEEETATTTATATRPSWVAWAAPLWACRGGGR